MANTAHTPIITVTPDAAKVTIAVAYPSHEGAPRFVFSAGLTGTMALDAFSIGGQTWTRGGNKVAHRMAKAVISGAYRTGRAEMAKWRAANGVAVVAPAPVKGTKGRKGGRKGKAKLSALQVTSRSGNGRLVRRWAEAIVAEMFTPEQAKRVHLTVSVRKLRPTLLGDATYRNAWTGDALHCAVRLNRRIGRRELAETLAHELRHVQQYASGRLVHRAGGCEWREHGAGKLEFHPRSSYNSRTNYAGYRAAPWEVEARAAEAIGTALYLAEVRREIGAA